MKADSESVLPRGVDRAVASEVYADFRACLWKKKHYSAVSGLRYLLSGDMVAALRKHQGFMQTGLPSVSDHVEEFYLQNYTDVKSVPMS